MYSDYLRTLCVVLHPVSTLLDCVVGGASPPPGAIRNRRPYFISRAPTLGTLLSLRHLRYCWLLVTF